MNCKKLIHRLGKAKKLKIKQIKSMILSGDYHINSDILASALLFGK